MTPASGTCSDVTRAALQAPSPARNANAIRATPDLRLAQRGERSGGALNREEKRFTGLRCSASVHSVPVTSAMHEDRRRNKVCGTIR